MKMKNNLKKYQIPFNKELNDMISIIISKKNVEKPKINNETKKKNIMTKQLIMIIYFTIILYQS